MRYESQIPASEYWSLEIDMNRDLASLMYDSLKRRGISRVGQRDPVYEYFNYMKRTIRIRPRTILKSREFSVPPEYEKALQNFEDDVRAGRDLNRYLSDKILQPAASDALLYDWNIVHFHLTRWFRPDGFAKRSDYQIFAWVTDDCLYLIQIYPHDRRKEPYLYSKQELVRIVERNWPQLLEPHRIPGAVKLTEQLDDKAYDQIHKAHITTAIQTGEGHVYCMIGGGYASDGSSGEAMRNANFWQNRMHICEEIIRENMQWIARKIRDYRGNHGKDYQIRMLKLPETADEVSVAELRYGVGIQLLLKQGRFRVYRMEEECWYRMCEKPRMW